METNGEDVVRGDAVAIWRYSPDSEARDTGMRRRDDYAIGKEGVGGEREVERERSERGRGSGGVVITVPCIQMVSRTHTNHNEQHPRARPIPLSNATGSIHRRCTVRRRVCVCACAYASGAASSPLLSHVESRNGNMQLGRQASLRRLENSKDLPGDPSGCELVARHRKDPGAAPLLCPFVITAARPRPSFCYWKTRVTRVTPARNYMSPRPFCQDFLGSEREGWSALGWTLVKDSLVK